MWRTGKSRAGGGITLRLLIDEKIVQPGENVLSVEYKGATNLATLTPDGRIKCVVRSQRCTRDLGIGIKTRTLCAGSLWLPMFMQAQYVRDLVDTRRQEGRVNG